MPHAGWDNLNFIVCLVVCVWCMSGCLQNRKNKNKCFSLSRLKCVIKLTFMDPQVRQLKDFLALYNVITEQCFGSCVDSMMTRKVENDEVIKKNLDLRSKSAATA